MTHGHILHCVAELLNHTFNFEFPSGTCDEEERLKNGPVEAILGYNIERASVDELNLGR